MNTRNIKRFFFREPATTMAQSTLLLVSRIIFGFLFMSHGITKWIVFGNMTENFPDPLGLGPTLSYWLALFAEILCSFGVVLGALFRLCLIPIIFTMLVAVFVVHMGDPLPKVEPALMYLVIFIIMFICGPGYFSVDAAVRYTTR